MSQYVIDTDDPESEPTWTAYKTAQRDILSQVSVAYRAVSVALGMYAELGSRLIDGDLAAAAAYHQAATAGLLDSQTALLGHLQAALDIIEAMQAARPGLFPGVPEAAA